MHRNSNIKGAKALLAHAAIAQLQGEVDVEGNLAVEKGLLNEQNK